MKIIVCIKQVPDTEDIKWTENNTINREGVESIINPYDNYALYTALSIKEKLKENKTEITVLTMGPPQAKNALKEALSYGADRAILLSDKAFSGSDTSATSRIISQCVNEKEKDFDLIICGQYAIDGETGQTGPSIAQNLGIDLVTNIINLIDVQDKYIVVEREIEEGYEVVKTKVPSLLCISKIQKEIEVPKIINRIKAQDTKIIEYNADDIGILKETTGCKGSPTYVKKACKPEVYRRGKIVENIAEEEMAELIIKYVFEAE